MTELTLSKRSPTVTLSSSAAAEPGSIQLTKMPSSIMMPTSTFNTQHKANGLHSPNPVYTTLTNKAIDAQYLVDSVQSVGLRSANTADYVKRCTRTKFSERCFSHAGPAAWNSLPASIKLTTDTNRFKKLLIAHQFQIAF